MSEVDFNNLRTIQRFQNQKVNKTFTNGSIIEHI